MENGSTCVSHLLVFIQLCITILSSLIVLILIMMFYEPVEARGGVAERKRAWLYFWLAWLSCAVGLGALAAFIAYFGPRSDAVKRFADVTGFINATANVVAYAPQLYSTYKLKHVGSVSILTYMIQAPGAWLLVAFQVSANRSDYLIYVPR